MKKIILLMFIIMSVKSFAQTDSSKLTITLTLKQKNISYMGYMLSSSNTIPDAHFRDTLIKYLGSGANPDSQIVTHFQGGVLIKFITSLFGIASGVTYATLNEIANGSSGYVGLSVQLGTKVGQANSEQGISRWLITQLVNLLGSGTTVFNTYLSTGTSWLQTPINFN